MAHGVARAVDKCAGESQEESENERTQRYRERKARHNEGDHSDCTARCWEIKRLLAQDGGSTANVTRDVAPEPKGLEGEGGGRGEPAGRRWGVVRGSPTRTNPFRLTLSGRWATARTWPVDVTCR